MYPYPSDIKREQLRVDFFKDRYCEECGTVESLLLHHKDPSTKTVKRTQYIWHWADGDRRQKEIDKCIVLCIGCHTKIHGMATFHYPWIDFVRNRPVHYRSWRVNFQKKSRFFQTKKAAIEFANQFALDNFNNMRIRRVRCQTISI